MNNIIKQLKNPPSKYRPVPFWSWNSELKTEETRWQINEMNKVGMGGFFMHARGGLTTEYLGKDWMDNVRAAIDEGDKHDMHAWGYDENGWPSGFGSDKVSNLGVEYQQKYLRMEITEDAVSDEATICNNKLDDGRIAHFYYDINPFYVDVLDAKVADEFIKSTHEKYKSALGEDFAKMDGFFTDEPQMSRDGIPWSFILNDEYIKEYGEPLLPLLYDLFCETDTCKKTRFRFWKLVTRLFSENFLGRIYTWCENNGVKLTGHMVCEETLHSQLECNGAVMPNYEYFHIPGVDKLGLEKDRWLLNSQVGSVCAQLGKKQILTESFACCGWDVSFEEMKHLYEWQMVKGVNLLCQHLAGYSLEGIRKRDYPAGHFYQNPWWDDYNDFNDFASRMGLLLSEGDISCECLVLHPISSAWIHNAKDSVERIHALQDSLSEVLKTLDAHRIIHHLGDDRIMLKYAGVDNGRLNIGKMSYSVVIVPPCDVLDSNTYKLLCEFEKSGGKLIFVGETPAYIDGEPTDVIKDLCKISVKTPEEILTHLPQIAMLCRVTDKAFNNVDIQLAHRVFDDFEMYYLVNTFSDKTDAIIQLHGKSVAKFDYLTGEVTNIPYIEKDGVLTINHIFEKGGSVVYFVRKDSLYSSAAEDVKKQISINDKLYGEWEIAKSDDNVFTLDRCDLYFDGELCRKNVFVSEIQQLACDLKRKVKIAMDFDINFDRRPVDKLSLVIERPENYRIYINGKPVKNEVTGYYREKAFKVIDVTGLFDIGYNIITLECDFVQSEEVYETLDKCGQFESVKNKLYYDMEIESIYLIGEFCVNCSEDYKKCDTNGIKTSGSFSLTKKRFNISDGDIAPQGYPFFCGSMTLKKSFTLTQDETYNRCLEFLKLCAVVTKIRVNGNETKPMYWAPYTVDLSSLLVEGENTIEVEFTTSFRNMLGPHHLGENKKFVAPHSFFKSSRIWSNYNIQKFWDDNTYSFSEIGLFLK